ncbi:MAG: DPP IV N-terminal domain-containing protein [Parabacteroides sp.]
MRKSIWLATWFVSISLLASAGERPVRSDNAGKDEVTRADYLRSDSILKMNDRVYSGLIRPAWVDSSHYFWYKNHEKGGDCFYLVNAATGKRHKAADKQGLAAYFSKRDKKLAESLLQEEERHRGEWHHREEAKPVPSPDGRWEAYIRDNNVYIAEVTEEKPAAGTRRVEVALTLDGSPNLRYDAAALQWSPDGKKLATLRVRDIQERRIPLIESSPSTQKQPILQWRDYAKPGDLIPVSLPVLIDVEKRQVIPVDASAYENQYMLYLTGWRADSRAFTFEFNQRGHQRYVVGEVNATDGTIRPLIEEKTPTFIHYYKNFRYDVNDGKELLWISERDGWRHLYLIDGTDGRVKQQVTRGEWVVREVEQVDEANRTIYFYASGLHAGEDPYNLHYCRIRFDGTGFTDLTPEAANHHVYPSADRTYFVDCYSRPDLAPVSQLKRMADASVVMPLESCDLTELQAMGWVMPEVFTAKGRDGKTDIWGNVYRPTHFDPNRRYPVVEMIYAGPHDSHVDKDFKATHHLISRLVELGFVVVSIDGMGTSNRSKAFHDVCWKNLKDAGFPDRIAWIKALGAKYSYLDLERVGIYGWSAGGQNAMAALLWHNDFYKVAVALCGCHDNRMDKIWWNEQWMGYPVDASYSASSNVDNAALLKGKLLLINGELDDNVDPASTLQVVKALMDAGKNFEQLYLPGKTHSLGGPFELHKMHDFFVKHLKRQDPPEWE